MSIADRLALGPVDTSKRFCTVGFLLEELETGAAGGGDARYNADYNAFAGALSVPSWSATKLSATLALEGHTVSVLHIRQHRRGEHDASQCARHTVGVIYSDGGAE